MFRTIDRNRDNMIDFDEFLAFYRQDMTTAKHFWAMLAPSTDSKISWGEFSGNQVRREGFILVQCGLTSTEIDPQRVIEGVFFDVDNPLTLLFLGICSD